MQDSPIACHRVGHTLAVAAAWVPERWHRTAAAPPSVSVAQRCGFRAARSLQTRLKLSNRQTARSFKKIKHITPPTSCAIALRALVTSHVC